MNFKNTHRNGHSTDLYDKTFCLMPFEIQFLDDQDWIGYRLMEEFKNHPYPILEYSMVQEFCRDTAYAVLTYKECQPNRLEVLQGIFSFLGEDLNLEKFNHFNVM